MKNNILLRLSEAARSAVLKSNGSEEHRFAVEKTLALFLWFLAEWEQTVRSKKDASDAMNALWDAVCGHIDIYLDTGAPETVNATLTEMSRWVEEALK